MTLIETVYTYLAADTALQSYLAKDPLTDAAAIYETWANEATEMPYIVQTHQQRRGNHFAKIDGVLLFDIFTNKNTIQAETIRDRLLELLDQRSIEGEPGDNARFYYLRDQDIGDPVPDVVHWQLVFDVIHWRQNWIEYSETLTP